MGLSELPALPRPRSVALLGGCDGKGIGVTALGIGVTALGCDGKGIGVTALGCDGKGIGVTALGIKPTQVSSGCEGGGRTLVCRGNDCDVKVCAADAK